MRNFRAFFLVFPLILAIFSQIEAEETQSRIIFHGHREIHQGWSISAWSIFPNISANRNNLVIAGPSYYQENWYIEGMAGQVVKEQGQGSFLLNIRSFYKSCLFHAWAEVEYFPEEQNLYWFAQLDFPVNVRGDFLGKVGVETEDTHFLKAGKNSLGLGPHLIFSVADNFTIITAYQWRRGHEKDFVRFYTVIDF
ncbi:MAG: hypothetical protein PHR36_02615 [Patescibacteria group bacterium]|nr:hypothetical protein [Patescibacteria group bacterium]